MVIQNNSGQAQGAPLARWLSSKGQRFFTAQHLGLRVFDPANTCAEMCGKDLIALSRGPV